MSRKTDIFTEIVNFKTTDGVSAESMLEVITALDATYLSMIDGYIDSELIQGVDNQSWIMIIHWRNDEETHQAIKEFPTSPLTAEYRSILEPQSIKLHFGEQTGHWGTGR